VGWGTFVGKHIAKEMLFLHCNESEEYYAQERSGSIGSRPGLKDHG